MATIQHKPWGSLALLFLALCGCGLQPITTGEAQNIASPITLVKPTNSSSTLPSTTSAMEPTFTPDPTIVSVTTAIEIPLPDPAVATPTPSIAGLENTLLLYTTIVNMRASPNRPPSVSTLDDYWAFRTWPPLPFLDPTIFDTFYGKSQYADDMGMFFLDFRPKLSPDGRYLLLPGLSSYPDAGIEGTGTWLVDLEESVTRELLPDGRIATWNPTSDAIAYVEDDTLYTLSIIEGSEPQPIFEHPDLWSQYAHWSPDGQWIATLTSSLKSTDEYESGFAATYWLVPPVGDPARELTTQEAGAIEYCSCDMSWSPDGQYLLARNRVFDLEGNLLSSGYLGRVNWLPEESQLLNNGNEGLSIISIAGDEIARISDTYANEWAFSHDGRQLAYTQGGEGEPTSIAIYDLDREESRIIRSGSAEPLRWSADDSHLLLSIFRDEQLQIIMVSVEPNDEEQVVMDGALLIEVVPYSIP